MVGARFTDVTFSMFESIASLVIRRAWVVVVGWLALIAIKPLMSAVPPTGIVWLVAGGLFGLFKSIRAQTE